MNQYFSQQIVKTLKWEGGYTNDPDDPGGETKYGISKKAHPQTNIATLTRDEAIAIYAKEYWDHMELDLIPPVISMRLFDQAVVMGQRQATIALQKALYEAGNYVPVDGMIGPRTRAAIMKSRLDLLSAKFMYELQYRYHEIVKANPALTKFLDGWIDRSVA